MSLSKTFILVTVFLATVVVTPSCGAKEAEKKYSGSKIPGLQQDVLDSLPQPRGYVNDFENLFSDEEERLLHNLIKDFEKRTTIQIALITIDTSMTTADSLAAWTLRIANNWGVGQKNKNNGVTIGISAGYRQIRIQNGYGIEKILSDAETKMIIDTAFLPRFQEANYFKGTYTGVLALMKTLEERNKK